MGKKISLEYRNIEIQFAFSISFSSVNHPASLHTRKLIVMHTTLSARRASRSGARRKITLPVSTSGMRSTRSTAVSLASKSSRTFANGRHFMFGSSQSSGANSSSRENTSAKICFSPIQFCIERCWRFAMSFAHCRV